MKTVEVKESETVNAERLFYIKALAALDMLPKKKLVWGALSIFDFVTQETTHCVLGAYSRAYSARTYVEDIEALPNGAVNAIILENDRDALESGEDRYTRMHAWLEHKIMR